MIQLIVKKKRYETLQKLNSAQLDQITREEKLSALRGDSIEQQALLQKQAIQSQIDAKYLEKQQVKSKQLLKMNYLRQLRKCKVKTQRDIDALALLRSRKIKHR
jgi:hypothetical protein